MKETKPRLVFFQFDYSRDLPEFLLIHKREHAACLSKFFDVTVLDSDSDYDEVCERYEPDLTVFESGVPNPGCRRPKISNTNTHASIPKLGFLNADGFCCAREGFLSDMDQWGIEWFVAIATSAPEHMASIADRMFIWPNSVDTSIYQDYREWKSIPVLFTGNKSDIYPWRRTMIQAVSNHFPTMICPHPGYGTRRNTVPVPVGEAYARMLNAAWFVPACGTVAREAVRKHFEIPACVSCLVTERSPALEAAGFVDMVNCVFANEHDGVDKLSQLLGDKARLQAVIEAGHRLVIERHTNENRTQVLQWYKLQGQLSNGKKIVQPNPFGDLKLVPDSYSPGAPYLVSGARHLALLREGDEKLRAGNYKVAEKLYLRCANYIGYMPEPKLRLAICNLYMGRPAKAMSWIAQPLQFTLAEYKAADPDPVEWSWFLLVLLCLGDAASAVKSSRQFEWLLHPELDRVRRVLHLLSPRSTVESRTSGRPVKNRSSIHQLPELSWEEWLKQLGAMLSACGQGELARRIVELMASNDPPENAEEFAPAAIHRNIRARRSRAAWPGSLAVAGNTVHALRAHSAQQALSGTLKALAKKMLHRIERKYGYALPYRLSAARRDDPFRAIEELAQKPDMRAALIIGAQPGGGKTEAVLAGAGHNANRPSVICLSASLDRVRKAKPAASAGIAGWYSMPANRDDASSPLQEILRQARREHNIDRFDLVLVDGSELGEDFPWHAEIQGEVARARALVLDDINMQPAGDIHHSALRSPALILVDQDLDIGDGFSIFARDANCCTPAQ